MNNESFILNPNELRISKREFSIAEITGTKYRQLHLKDNVIQAWEYEKQCSLIESIMVRIPIGNFVVEDVIIKDDSGKYISEIKRVVDGECRLIAIKNFMNNSLILRDMKYLPNINGQTWETLERSLQRRFKSAMITCYELELGMSEDVKNDLVKRMKC